MAIDLSNTLIVAISATALFDLTESERYREKLLQDNPAKAAALFRNYMQRHDNGHLETSAGFPLIQAILNLNHYAKKARR